MPAARKCLIPIALLLVLGCALPLGGQGFRPPRAERAMVVSAHELASQAGVEMMRKGGNAVDAAVATGFALAVVYPRAGNLGGGGFMLLRTASGEVHFLDYREKAPAAATRDMFLDAQGNVVENLSVEGYKASGVPGSVAGMVTALRKWGKLPLRTVLQPAIRHARQGFVLTDEDAETLRRPVLGKFPESRRIFQRDGKFYQPGEVFRQPELAQTLERIAAEPDEFYRGRMAQQIAEAVQAGGGLITAKDLADYQPKERQPIRGAYRGFEILSAPPPSSGGVALIEILNILEGFELSKMGNRSAQAIHLTAEAFRRAFKDRAELLGDPDFASVPVAQLTDKRYAAAWRESIHPHRATRSNWITRPSGFGDLDRQAQLRAPALIREPTETTHYSVVDGDGNAVAVTTTINAWFGSGVTVPGLGFLLNNEMDDFTVKAGVPNMFGLIQGEANAIEPAKRPLSAMTPTIVTRAGKLFLVAGSPGGPRIITTVANIITGVVDLGLDVQQAVTAPRFHHQWVPDVLRLEGVGFSPDTVEMLRERGHTVEFGIRDSVDEDVSTYWGAAECIWIDPKSGHRLAGVDPRRSGAAAGF